MAGKAGATPANNRFRKNGPAFAGPFFFVANVWQFDGATSHKSIDFRAIVAHIFALGAGRNFSKILSTF
ncbi:hypothetical protein [Pelagibacterium sp.]|uniref:hypothetical protein n=1 Tax=Pelagibacterium sp. TaxID=1967288 RepID=UPI003BAD369A